MKNRIIALLMVLVMVVLAVVSCGPNGGGETPGGGGGNKPTPTPDPNTGVVYPWDTTTLVFQMTENSNKQELPSTCKRYLAGDVEGVNDVSAIDQFVSDRNDAAEFETKTEIEYSYLPDTKDKYTWGENIEFIVDEVKAREPGRPDMYCNFVYDMVAISLKGVFANLLSTKMYPDGHKYAGLNYFDFTSDPFYEDNGEGYMVEYMRSLTLSKYKMYCLSSDYFTDMVRAFLIVPVNIGLLQSLQTEGTYDETTKKGDYLADRTPDNGTSSYTIEDFYQLVEDKEWNYTTLAQFSTKIFSEGDDGDENQDLRDTIGFAIGTNSGLPASGMLYTSSITIINNDYNKETKDYSYSYPNISIVGDPEAKKAEAFVVEGTHDELTAFCDNLNTLMNATGVIAVDAERGDTHSFGETDLQAIRERFASGFVLFGGVICLGSLEYDQYKTMNGQGKSGYGIVPVPLYRTNYVDANGETKVDDYLTQIHNIGRIGAISYTTEKYAQCTAYLNYQCTHSTEILNEYYDYKLKYDVVGTGVNGNAEMLKYIRAHVDSAFDKAFEDALGKHYSENDDQAMKQQWHTMIKNEHFQLENMTSYYESLTPLKAYRLYNLEHSIYPSLPD